MSKQLNEFLLMTNSSIKWTNSKVINQEIIIKIPSHKNKRGCKKWHLNKMLLILNGNCLELT